jgi:hypothetical protein
MPPNNREELVARLEGVDFKGAAGNIAFTFREGARQSALEGKQLFMKSEQVEAANRFMEAPSIESAIMLLEEYPSFLPMFELTKSPLQVLSRNLQKESK